MTLDTLKKNIVSVIDSSPSKARVRRISVFGSYAKGTETKESDIDLLVEFDSENVPDLFEFIGIRDELENCLGKSVDLVTHDALNKYLRDEILASAKEVYEQK